jgi:hypothetical protein
MWLTLIEREIWLMKEISQPTQTGASSIAPVTVVTGTNGCGNPRAAGNAAIRVCSPSDDAHACIDTILAAAIQTPVGFADFPPLDRGQPRPPRNGYFE